MEATFDLKGKVAVVTGGGRGIGRAIALGLAGVGASVVIAGRTAERIRIDCESVANHDLIRWLNKPGVICGLYI